MALTLLADRWARRRGGVVEALTVDHRLRAGSTAEARRVKDWLAVRGIAHRTLTWRKGAGVGHANLQARARAARYGLMEGWCRRRGALHLVTAHHIDDQAETLLLRLARGSGLSGLAAMAPIVDRPGVRILRPLLGLSHADLIGHLRSQHQDWIEDPSNEDIAFARVRMRAAMPAFAAAGLDAHRLAATAARLGRARAAMDADIARLLAAAAPDPAGFVSIAKSALISAADEIAFRALARIIGAVGGEAYPPRFNRLKRLYGELAGLKAGRTLGGCRILPQGDGFLICREPAAMAPPLTIDGPGTGAWDGRFLLRFGGRAGSARIRVAALGAGGWATLRHAAPDAVNSPRAMSLPRAVRASLPAVFDSKGLREVPHLGYRRKTYVTASLKLLECRPFPAIALAGPGFAFPAAQR
jgi:tRNA(Ile)-lysidine synthase